MPGFWSFEKPFSSDKSRNIFSLLLFLAVLAAIPLSVSVLQQKQTLRSRADEPIVISQIQNFFPVSININRGKILVGDYKSLASKDRQPFVLNPELVNNLQTIDWYSEFNITTGKQVNSLAVSYNGKYSTWEGQTLLLYDFKSSVWRTVGYRTIGASIVDYDTTIQNPTAYVSPEGTVRVRIFAQSPLAFFHQTDYFAIKVGYALFTPRVTPIYVLPTQEPTSTPTLTPTSPIPTQEPTPTPFVAPTSPPLTSTNFVPASVDVSKGNIVYGQYENLGSKDKQPFVVNSVANNNLYSVDWYAEYNLPKVQLSAMTIYFTGKYSTWEGQNLYLFNFQTNNWESLHYRTIGASIVDFDLPISDPMKYVSGDGKVRVRIFAQSPLEFFNQVDYLGITIKY